MVVYIIGSFNPACQAFVVVKNKVELEIMALRLME
mgnify:FL=1